MPILRVRLSFAVCVVPGVWSLLGLVGDGFSSGLHARIVGGVDVDGSMMASGRHGGVGAGLQGATSCAEPGRVVGVGQVAAGVQVVGRRGGPGAGGSSSSLVGTGCHSVDPVDAAFRCLSCHGLKNVTCCFVCGGCSGHLELVHGFPLG